MPELPEVETIRRQIAPLLQGREIASARALDPRWVQPLSPATFARALKGRTIEQVQRRGKYFVLPLDNGSALLLHLRMTGNLLYLNGLLSATAADKRPAHLRGWLELSHGATLAFVDPRRFGTAELLKSPTEAHDYFASRLGPEPFDADFNAEMLHGATRRRKTSIKALLLDQKQVAGIGNIYADEALFRAGIAPGLRADRLTKAQCARLSETIRDALTAGIDAKGASIDDYRDAYGIQGSFQDQFLVHRREGLPCPECGAPVIKTRVAGRGTYHCRNCQRR